MPQSGATLPLICWWWLAFLESKHLQCWVWGSWVNAKMGGGRRLISRPPRVPELRGAGSVNSGATTLSGLFLRSRHIQKKAMSYQRCPAQLQLDRELRKRFMNPPLCSFPALTFVLGSLLPTLITPLKFYLVILKFLVSQRSLVFSASFINDRGSSCLIIFLTYLLFIKAHPAQVRPLGRLPSSTSLQGAHVFPWPQCSWPSLVST